MTEEEFLRRFDSGDTFTESEIQDMCCKCVGNFVDERVVDADTWTIVRQVIFEVKCRLFSVMWREVEDEWHDYHGEYFGAPIEVRRLERVVYDFIPLN